MSELFEASHDRLKYENDYNLELDQFLKIGAHFRGPVYEVLNAKKKG